MTLAFNSRHPHVKKGNRWIASLSDGTTVFEDKTPKIKSAWRRLQDHVEQHNLQVTNLRLEAYGKFVKLLSYRADDGRVQIDGYWQSSRKGAFFGTGAGGEIDWRGVGFIKDEEVTIIWVDDNGNITQEVRDLSSAEMAAIINKED
jgi:hypothetical protein